MSEETPTGDLTLRTMAMPADTNANGDIFGGWVLSQMDLAGGIAAGARAEGRVVTIAVDKMKFIRPVHVGDVLCVYTGSGACRHVFHGNQARSLGAQASLRAPGKGHRGDVHDGRGGRQRQAKAGPASRLGDRGRRKTQACLCRLTMSAKRSSSTAQEQPLAQRLNKVCRR